MVKKQHNVIETLEGLKEWSYNSFQISNHNTALSVILHSLKFNLKSECNFYNVIILQEQMFCIKALHIDGSFLCKNAATHVSKLSKHWNLGAKPKIR